MTTIRQALRRLLEKKPASDRPMVAFSYAVYWTRTVQEWTPELRNQIAVELEKLLSTVEVDLRGQRRNYTLAALPGKHAGASLQSLRAVLKAHQQADQT